MEALWASAEAAEHSGNRKCAPRGRGRGRAPHHGVAGDGRAGLWGVENPRGDESLWVLRARNRAPRQALLRHKAVASEAEAAAAQAGGGERGGAPPPEDVEAALCSAM